MKFFCRTLFNHVGKSDCFWSPRVDMSEALPKNGEVVTITATLSDNVLIYWLPVATDRIHFDITTDQSSGKIIVRKVKKKKVLVHRNAHSEYRDKYLHYFRVKSWRRNLPCV